MSDDRCPECGGDLKKKEYPPKIWECDGCWEHLTKWEIEKIREKKDRKASKIREKVRSLVDLAIAYLEETKNLDLEHLREKRKEYENKYLEDLSEHEEKIFWEVIREFSEDYELSEGTQ